MQLFLLQLRIIFHHPTHPMIPRLETNSSVVRIASFLFFFVCVPLSVWETNVQSSVFVPQDPVATARNLLDHEFMFRISIVSHVIDTIFFLVMAFLFYKVFSPLDKYLATFMIVPIVAQLAIVFLLEGLNFTALMTLKAEARAGFDVIQQQEAAYFLMRIHRFGFGADKIIFGLFFIPLGIAVYRSGFAPRFVGVLMMMGGIGYVADTCLYILLQRADYVTVQSIKLYSSACYAIGLFWLLVKGVHEPHVVTSKTD